MSRDKPSSSPFIRDNGDQNHPAADEARRNPNRKSKVCCQMSPACHTLGID